MHPKTLQMFVFYDFAGCSFEKNWHLWISYQVKQPWNENSSTASSSNSVFCTFINGFGRKNVRSLDWFTFSYQINQQWASNSFCIFFFFFCLAATSTQTPALWTYWELHRIYKIHSEKELICVKWTFSYPMPLTLINSKFVRLCHREFGRTDKVTRSADICSGDWNSVTGKSSSIRGADSSSINK